ncbi:sulfotransferase domain-containing protein [Kutzneria sp. NPDC051319]|uniref:sulfotransferase domain-containing protein n=1 Tax=Kutzneria sp. NPDC051319 TaxID=3155047 RepID=UPI00343DFF68
MTALLPDASMALARVSALYRRNITMLGDRDVVVASHGGSGQSLIGNILFELGLNYVDAYTEELHADGRATVAPAHAGYRSHLASQHDKDRDAAGAVRLWPRFVKTHHPPAVFADATYAAVWLLVRDPRDAIYASYQWRAGFAEEQWDRVPGTFVEWLRGLGDFSPSPVDDWVAYYRAWQLRSTGPVLRFEDLKTRPVPVVVDALRPLGVDVTIDDVGRAVEASSFERMRRHEDRVADDRPRVIRSGRVEGWREWMTDELAAFFGGEDLRRLAAQCGYEL